MDCGKMRSIVSEGHNAIITTEKAINSKITIGEEGRRKNHGKQTKADFKNFI